MVLSLFGASSIARVVLRFSRLANIQDKGGEIRSLTTSMVEPSVYITKDSGKIISFP